MDVGLYALVMVLPVQVTQWCWASALAYKDTLLALALAMMLKA